MFREKKTLEIFHICWLWRVHGDITGTCTQRA
jgi:hypothetical protein